MLCFFALNDRLEKNNRVIYHTLFHTVKKVYPSCVLFDPTRGFLFSDWATGPLDAGPL